MNNDHIPNGTLQSLDSMPMRTLLIDNYDSYTYNLYQLIAQVNGAPPTVVYNDGIDAITLLKQLHQGLYHNIVISPGPGTPTAPNDIGLCLALIKAAPPIPILGVCLGFQALALAYGACILRASEPVHGRLSAIRHSGTHPLFSEIPSGHSYQVVRYHSLIVDESTLPEELEAIAWTAPGGHHALGLDTKNQVKNTTDSVAAAVAAAVLVENNKKSNTLGSQNGGLQSDNSSSVATCDGVLMAIAHTSLPYYGVQYHPESIGTAYGHELLKNFKELTLEYHRNGPEETRQKELLLTQRSLTTNGESVVKVNGALASEKHGLKTIEDEQQNQQKNLHVLFKKVPDVLTQHPQLTAQTIFDAIVLQSSDNSIADSDDSVLLEDTFWLDTAAVDRGRFSFMGGRGGALWRRVSYKLQNSSSSLDTRTTATTATTAVNGHSTQYENNSANNTNIPMSFTKRNSGGVLTSIDKIGNSTTTIESSFWDWLDNELDRWKVDAKDISTHSARGNSSAAATTSTAPAAAIELDNGEILEAASQLPFDFYGGLIGYLGYELKADGCGGKPVHGSTTPDASFFCIDQFIALDHKTGSVFAVAVVAARSEKIEETQAYQWVESTAALLENLRDTYAAKETLLSNQQNNNNSVSNTANANITNGSSPPSPPPPLQKIPSLSFSLREPKSHYLQNVQACMEALYAGDSYELCLTTEMRRPSTWGAREAWTLYKILRKVNPAPYAAWLHFAAGNSSPLSICCSSPERFLKGDKSGGLEAKPIKGTAPRHPNATPSEDAAAAAALASSEKDRAENLMIVDLLRNDLGRVCDPGTVHVPALMNIESFATVHQLVSTVRGRRRHDASVADAVRAAFPGGSMTGAPKVRSMDIIDQLEGGPRGVYSGSLGYFSFNGTFDLNIVIRTAVVHDGAISIGAGGAIVIQSEPEAEYDEMQLKAAALLKAVAQCDDELVKLETKKTLKK